MELCKRTGFDLDSALRRRAMCLLNNEEVRQVASESVDFELHTHRHRVFPQRKAFWKDLRENRARIEALTRRTTMHFCYPGGYSLPSLPEWLRATGVVSAATCELGLATCKSNPYFLPRLLDSATLSEIEFGGWLCGLAGLIPKRLFTPSPTQLGQTNTLCLILCRRPSPAGGVPHCPPGIMSRRVRGQARMVQKILDRGHRHPQREFPAF